jgi:hypothetical protein
MSAMMAKCEPFRIGRGDKLTLYGLRRQARERTFRRRDIRLQARERAFLPDSN